MPLVTVNLHADHDTGTLHCEASHLTGSYGVDCHILKIGAATFFINTLDGLLTIAQTIIDYCDSQSQTDA